ncbi:MAG: hypothetical protein ACOYOP_13050 [Microthrixaceae bacterium]
MPYQPADAPRLVAELSSARSDPAFVDSIDPSRRDAALAGIDAFLARPDAASLLSNYITDRRAADAAQRATGRLPAPPSPATLDALGLGDPIDPTTVEPTTTTVPDAEAAAPAAEVETFSSPSVQVPGSLEPVSTFLSGGQWPVGGPRPWPVGAGSKADKMAVARAGSGTLDPAANCTREATGPRHLPTDAVPSFEGRVYTPTQGAFASSGAPGSPEPGVITNYHGELVTRPDPTGSGITQMKVEAHLLSPTVDPVRTAAARVLNPSAPEVLANPSALRGHVVVEGLDGSNVSYFPGSPGTEWRTLCYAEDLGVTDVKRAYVEAWVPMRYPSVSDPRNLREPGFQVRFETVDAFWNAAAGAFPTFFYAADQATVILQGENQPLAHDAPVPGGSAAVRVADEVMVDRDGVPTNDLESILRSKIEPAIAPALDSFDNTWIPLLGIGVIIWVQDVKPGGASLDLDIRNIGPDDEAEFVGKFSLSGLRLRGAFTSPIGGCGYSTTVNGTLNVTGQINRRTGDVTSLQIDGGHYLSDVSTSKTFVIGPGLIETGLCWAAWWGGTKVALDALDSMARGRFDTLPDTKLSNTVELNAEDTVGPGTSTPGGGGFGITNVGFERSCFPKGCQGGDVLLDADGLAPAVGLSVRDNVPASGSRRFPVVYNPTLRTNLATLYNSAALPDQRPYKFAGFLHPTLVNQILRALAEGNGTPGSGMLERSGSGFSTRSDVAPILVTPSVSPLAKPLTVLVPDVRVSDGTNEFAVDVTAGIDLSVDAPTRKLRASLTVSADVETLQCGLSIAGPEGWVASYSLCASRDWFGDPGVALPSIPATIGFVVNDVVRPLVEKSLGEVEVPKVEGFDLLSLGSSKVDNVDGFPSVFVGYPQPSLDIKLSTPGSGLIGRATALGLPGTGAINYTWTFRDLYGSRVYTPLGSGDEQSDALYLYSPAPSGGVLWLRKFGARVTVTASRGGETRTTTADYVWYRP